MIHNLLLELVVLPNVLAIALHQVILAGWIKGISLGTRLFCILLLKVRVE